MTQASDDEIMDLLRSVVPMASKGFFLALHVRRATPSRTLSTMDVAWRAEYDAQSYGVMDPRCIWGMSHTGTIRWSDINIQDTGKVFAAGLPYGQIYGCLSSVGLRSSRSLMSFSRSDREFAMAEMDLIGRVTARIHEMTDMTGLLTPLMIEVLKLGEEGMRYSEMAVRLGISEKGVKARVAAARRNLDARTLAEAVRKARLWHLID